MNKKVLIIASSPRKGGNSDVLCEQFLQGTRQAGHNAEIIYLRNKKINYCTGCGACLGKKEDCAQKDDMSEILDKMIEADVIVLATPVYFYTMCAQMKTMIDRTCARYTKINGKEFYFIVTAADTSQAAMERTIEEFRGFTYCLNDARERGVIYGTGAWKIGEIKRTEAFNRAFEVGKQV